MRWIICYILIVRRFFARPTFVHLGWLFSQPFECVQGQKWGIFYNICHIIRIFKNRKTLLLRYFYLYDNIIDGLDKTVGVIQPNSGSAYFMGLAGIFCFSIFNNGADKGQTI